jgi:hypothetical protein
MLRCMSLLTWDAFAPALSSRRARSRRRLIDGALREWRGRIWPGLPARCA